MVFKCVTLGAPWAELDILVYLLTDLFCTGVTKPERRTVPADLVQLTCSSCPVSLRFGSFGSPFLGCSELCYNITLVV